MKTIRTTVVIDAEHKTTIQLPADVAPGTHAAILVLVDPPHPPHQRPSMADFPQHDVQVNLPEGFTFRREELYDDSGRGA